jgi:maltose alpha-D-glucosyltransferase/alpha-amylase
MLFTFDLTANVFLALARQDSEPIVLALEDLPTLSEGGQWVTFLRNLDELNLDQLAEDDREEVFRAFAPDPAMRVYGRGIRRRLTPMLEDRRRLEMAFSLLLSMPGTPIIVYGDEIGMGDDLHLPERDSVRTPMQWSDAPNGGFSAAPAAALTRPVITGGPFGYEHVNVAAQTEDPASQLNWLRQAIAARQRHPEFGRGSCRIIPTDDRRVVALCASWRGQETVAVHNLSESPCLVALDLEFVRDSLPYDHFADREYSPPASNRFELGPYGYRWLGPAI